MRCVTVHCVGGWQDSILSVLQRGVKFDKKRFGHQLDTFQKRTVTTGHKYRRSPSPTHASQSRYPMCAVAGLPWPRASRRRNRSWRVGVSV